MQQSQHLREAQLPFISEWLESTKVENEARDSRVRLDCIPDARAKAPGYIDIPKPMTNHLETVVSAIRGDAESSDFVPNYDHGPRPVSAQPIPRGTSKQLIHLD